MDDSKYINAEQQGFLANNGGGFQNNGSRAKSKDGDESVAMAGATGTASESWNSMLNDGCDNPYPTTMEALKTKNTRKNNDSFS